MIRNDVRSCGLTSGETPKRRTRGPRRTATPFGQGPLCSTLRTSAKGQTEVSLSTGRTWIAPGFGLRNRTANSTTCRGLSASLMQQRSVRPSLSSEKVPGGHGKSSAYLRMMRLIPTPPPYRKTRSACILSTAASSACSSSTTDRPPRRLPGVRPDQSFGQLENHGLGGRGQATHAPATKIARARVQKPTTA